MATKPEIERLAVVETNLHNLNEMVRQGFDDTKNAIKEINDKLDGSLPTFATTDYVEARLKEARSSKVKDLAIQSLIIGPISALIGYFFASVVK